MKYRCIKQYDSMDCAAACLASIAWYYGKKIPILEISEALETSKEGTSVWDVCRISEKLGLFASAYKKNYISSMYAGPFYIWNVYTSYPCFHCNSQK